MYINPSRVITAVKLISAVLVLYFIQVPIFILRIVLWYPLCYDLKYIYYYSKFDWKWYSLLAAYSLISTELMLFYYSTSLKLQVFQIIGMVSLSDALQMICGKLLGKHHLKYISPTKTYEGYIGAVLTIIMCWYWIPIKMGLLYVLFGIFGDLFESMCKRKLLLKDTSNILGSHGGWIDRCDGIFMSVLASYFY